MDYNKLWKILKEMGIPDHLTWLLRNLCAGQEATVRSGHGTTDWLQIRKGVSQGCINAGLDEEQAGIKIARRNISHLRYVDGTTLMAENKKELKSLLMEVKEESEKFGLKQHSENEDHGIQFHNFMVNRWGNNGNSDRLYFLGPQNHSDSDYSHEIK